MIDEPLLELKKGIKDLEKHDASFVMGFMSNYKIITEFYLNEGTPLQKAIVEYLDAEINEVYRVKSQNGKFKHLIKS